MENISREYYSMTDFAVSRTVDFIVGLESSEAFLGKAAEMYPGLVQDGSARFLFYFDLVKCYKKLGYEPNLSKNNKEKLYSHMFMFNEDRYYFSIFCH